MRYPALLCACAAAALALCASPAAATVGLESYDVYFEDGEGHASLQAGAHPFAMKVSLRMPTEPAEGGGDVPLESIRDFSFAQPPGFTGLPEAVAQCETLDFLALEPGFNDVPECSFASVVGIVEVSIYSGEEGGGTFTTAVYNLTHAPGTAAKLGFWVKDVPVTVDVSLARSYPYQVIASATNTSHVLEFLGAQMTLWGVPADPRHDARRGECLSTIAADECPAGIPPAPFLVLPRACEGPLASGWQISTWQSPASPPATGSTLTRDEAGNPRGMSGCGQLPYQPEISARPTNRSAAGPSGLDFELDVADPGIAAPEGRAGSDLKRAVVTLPEGVTLNPSQAEGLATCSPAQLARQGLDAQPGEGCPRASKVGTVEAVSPVLPKSTFHGEVFVATPYENPFDTLIAIYVTITEPALGVDVKLAGKVTPDPRTGQLVTTFGDPGSSDPAFAALPQLPVSHFRLHLREGGRSPLITPRLCGDYTAVAELTPWANPSRPIAASSSFRIDAGIDGGPCPPAGTPPFEPGFQAGTLDGTAASYSPFLARLTRRDGDQDLTKLSFRLPPGLLARLVGVSRCPDAAIAAAKAKTGIEERDHPSCPASSQIGTATAGAGVGSQLTYVGGKIYLAPPYNGAPLSVVAIVPALAGPFDVGTVVTRQALDVDPRTAEGSIDGSRSDPIPHILAGIPLSVRDIQVSIDRPDFTLNPTDCRRFSIGAGVWGGGNDLFSAADDVPVERSVPFEASECARLGFRPSLSLRLRGGTRRGAHPALSALYRPRAGDANLRRLALLLPRSEFVENAHFRTICTRVQYAAGPGGGAHCPKGSVYGHVKAWTPLLDEPLSGPVFLRSSDHLLPDAVFALHGTVDAEVVVRIDSHKGRLRATVQGAPDVPVSRVAVRMQGARKGLFVNSRDICAARYRAKAASAAHNGRAETTRPLMRASCHKARKRAQRRHRRR